MSNTINYVVSYDSDYLMPDGVTPNSNANVLTGVTNLTFHRDVAPSEDNATITLAGMGYTDSFGAQHPVKSAREVYFYRVNSDGTYTLKFRGMTTNPEYDVSDAGLVTTVQVNSLWYSLQTRLFQIAGKSPPPLQPNTNPYLVYLNPTLGLRFGIIWADIIVNAYQNSYSTGHLPPLHLVNLNPNGTGNMNVGISPPYFTDFDDIVVNDNMNIQYQSIDATINRLVTSALFNSNATSPYLAEYRMDIGEYPYGSWTGTVAPLIPCITVMLFDPVHSKLGNGCNRTGTTIGDNSLDPAGTLPDALQYPMDYIEFGVTNGYEPIDSIIFSEGDNVVSTKLKYDYISMNNSYVLTGGSFQGSDVVSLPIDNQRSIAEYGLKQTNQSLSNVVDQGEISRFVGTSINFFQHPIPNIVVIPDYVYASQHTLYPGDYIRLNVPSLVGILEDSQGVVIPSGAFISRIRGIDITWSSDDGEDITFIMSFPLLNVSGSPAGAMQFMYTTIAPAASTLLGRGRQNEGAATYGSGGDFITNKANPFNIRVYDAYDNTVLKSPIPDIGFQPLPVYAQAVPNAMNAINIAGNSVKGDDINIYQFGVEVDTQNVSATTTSSSSSAATTVPSTVVLTVLQPDGMAIYDGVLQVNQMANILSLISKSHSSVISSNGSIAFFEDDVGNVNLSGKYEVIIRNTEVAAVLPDPLFATLPAPIATGGISVGFHYPYYIYCPVDANGNEFAMSYEYASGNTGTPGNLLVLTWPAVANAVSYNIYVAVGTVPPATHKSTYDILQFVYLDNSLTNSYPSNGFDSGPANTQPFDQSLTPNVIPLVTPFGLNAIYNGTLIVAPLPYLQCNHYYWYVITAIDPAGSETTYSQTVTPFNLPSDNTYTNSVPEPDANSLPECGSRGMVTMGLEEIEISWPSVSGAVSYNVYRADGGLVNTMPLNRTDFGLITPTPITATILTDDGVTYPADMGTNPPSISIAVAIPTNILYTVYTNYSFQANPIFTKSIANAQGNNPNSAAVYNPTAQWIYSPHVPCVLP